MSRPRRLDLRLLLRLVRVVRPVLAPPLAAALFACRQPPPLPSPPARATTPNPCASASGTDAATRPEGVVSLKETGGYASASIGEASSPEDREAALQAYVAGHRYFLRHEWTKAESALLKAVTLDGARALYHAELGRVYTTEERWAEAQASFSAAVLLDVDNPEYRRLLKLARSRHAP